jgi:hypothetical protein
VIVRAPCAHTSTHSSAPRCSSLPRFRLLFEPGTAVSVGAQWELQGPLSRTDQDLAAANRFRRRTDRRCCRGAMGIAADAGAHRPAPRPPRYLRARTRRPTLPPGDHPSGSFSNECGQHPLRIEIRFGGGNLSSRNGQHEPVCPPSPDLQRPGVPDDRALSHPPGGSGPF